MRGKKAKALRKSVYGELSHRGRRYSGVRHEKEITLPPKKKGDGSTKVKINPVTLINIGLRKTYQLVKKTYHKEQNENQHLQAGKK